jgi:hypothetical protein
MDQFTTDTRWLFAYEEKAEGLRQQDLPGAAKAMRFYEAHGQHDLDSDRCVVCAVRTYQNIARIGGRL